MSLVHQRTGYSDQYLSTFGARAPGVTVVCLSVTSYYIGPGSFENLGCTWIERFHRYYNGYDGLTKNHRMRITFINNQSYIAATIIYKVNWVNRFDL